MEKVMTQSAEPSTVKFDTFRDFMRTLCEADWNELFVS
jgi:hypothetical protein